MEVESSNQKQNNSVSNNSNNGSNNTNYQSFLFKDAYKALSSQEEKSENANTDHETIKNDIHEKIIKKKVVLYQLSKSYLSLYLNIIINYYI